MMSDHTALSLGRILSKQFRQSYPFSYYLLSGIFHPLTLLCLVSWLQIFIAPAVYRVRHIFILDYFSHFTTVSE